MENLNAAQYLGLTLFDVYMISYLGQIIQNQTVRVRDFLYELPWFEFGAPFRRSMLIMLMYTIRPQIITGGKFFALGYDKFTGVIKLNITINYYYQFAIINFRCWKCRFRILHSLIKSVEISDDRSDADQIV